MRLRSSPGSLRKAEEVEVVVSVTLTLLSLAGGAAASASPGTGALMHAMLVMAASSPVSTIVIPRDFMSMLIALLSGESEPTRVVLPFLVITLVLVLYRCIAVAFCVTVLLSAFINRVSRGGVNVT